MHGLLQKINWIAIGTGMLLVFVAGRIPLWRRWNVSSWEAFGGFATLWSAIENMAMGNPHIELLSWLFVWHWENWIQGGIVFFVGFACGWGIYKMSGSPAAPPTK